MRVITHRGLDAEGHHAFTESSREAFQYFLDDGFGLEFDIQITRDGVPVISHDASLSRLAGRLEPDIALMSADDFLATELPQGHPVALLELIGAMKEAGGGRMHALHLKHHNQAPVELELLMPHLAELSDLPIMVFDVAPAVAKKIKQQIPLLSLAASVAHPYDIARYGGRVGGTLVSAQEMLTYRGIYDWAWLDEWDRTGENGEEKALYTAETLSNLRAVGYTLAVVSPELHAASPELADGGAHQDAQGKVTLEARWRELVALGLDAICTDNPYRIKELFS